MTTLAGTVSRRTVGVAGEPTVGRAMALVAVVMCLAAVSETSYGASNGGLGEVPTAAALFVLPLLYVFPATRLLWLRLWYRARPGPSATPVSSRIRCGGMQDVRPQRDVAQATADSVHT